MAYTLDDHIDHIKNWLKTGELNPDMLSDNFTFSSPFWREANRSAFIEKFLDPTEYIEKSVSNITGYTPMIACKSDCGHQWHYLKQQR